PRLRDGPRAQYAVRRRRAAPIVPPLAFVRSQAHKASTYPPAHAAQPADPGRSGRGYQREGLTREHRAGRDPARACGATRRQGELQSRARQPMTAYGAPMILEVAILDVRGGLEREFEAAFAQASPIIASMP